MINLEYIYYLLLSFTSALIFIPIGLSIIKKLNIVDRPNYRKIHKEVIPSGGGIFIFFGMLTSFIFIIFQSFENVDQFNNVKYLFIY